MHLYFNIPGIPRAKGRPRVCNRGGHAHAYTPKTTAKAERVIADTAARAIAERWGTTDGWPLDGPLCCELIYFMRRGPKDKELIWPMKKPDIDNMEKLVLDALTGVAWHDDVQVVKVEHKKQFENRHTKPCVRVLIWQAGFGKPEVR